MQLIPPYRSGQKRPWGSIPRINRGHPLAVGLVFYAYDAGGEILDLVNGGAGAIIASTTRLTRTTSKYGIGFNYPGTSTSDSITLPLSNKATQGFTNTAPYSVASGFFGAIGTPNYFTSTGTASVDVAGFNVITGPNLSFFCNNGGTQLNYAASLTANVYHTGVFVATSATAGLMYFDGKLDTSVSAITTTNATTGQQVNFNTGTANAQNFGGGLNGYIYYWAGWNRILTPGEASLLHADPYCFLIYPEDEIFATLVGTTAAVAAVTLGGTAKFYAPNLGPEFGFKPNLAFPPSITVPIFATSAFFDVIKLKQPIITIPDIVPRFPPPKLAGDIWFEPIKLKRPVIEVPPVLFNPPTAAAVSVVEQPFFEPIQLKRPSEFTQGPFGGTSPPLSGTFATSSFFEPIKLKQPIIDQPPVFPPIVTVALAIVEQPFFDIIRSKQPIITVPDNLPSVRTLPFGSLINWFDPNRLLKVPERLSDVFFSPPFPSIKSLSSWFDSLKKTPLREAFDWTATGAIQLNTVRYAISDWYPFVKPIGYRALPSIETPQLFFFPAVTPTIAATYRLLVDHYILNTYLLANTTVTEGIEVPLGWVPTIAAEPLNTTAIQNYWNAGPSGVSSAQYGIDYFSAPFFLGPPTRVGVFWQQIAGSAGRFQLTGAGASLGIKQI